MKKILVILSILLLSVTAATAANTGNISGTLQDKSNDEPLIGALIRVIDTTGKLSEKNYSTETGGKINIKGLPYGHYKVVFSFLGFNDLETTVTLNSGSINLGALKMEPSTIGIKTIVFEAPAIRTSQKGDTVIYNASAFKVATDAATEGLLSKMPGITISSDGSVEAQGETVKKVFVDGKEFFGEDVGTAIKNLPAEVVESVQVFNKLSDKAEFTGLDDGEGYKALNIVTTASKRKGQFGKVYAAYGYPDYYTAGGNVNIFNGDSRVSIIGLANNINQQNFSFEDILGVVNTKGSSSGGGGMGRRGGGAGSFMVRPMDGIATVQAIGINYSDTWGKRDNVSVTGSYFFNHSNNRDKYTNQTWQNDQNLTDVQYNSEIGNSNASNYNHRFNAKIDYKINDNQSLMIRPFLSYQSYAETNFSNTDIDSIRNDLTTPVKSIVSGYDNDRNGFYGGLNALYRVKLGKNGRTLTVNLDGNYNSNNYLQKIEEYTYIPRYTESATADSIGNKNISADSFSYRLGGGISYTEPLNKKSQLNIDYRATYNYSDGDTRTYLWDPVLSIINPEFSEQLSTINNSGYLTQRVGPGYRYADGKTSFSLSVMYQHSLLDNNITFPVRDNPYETHSFSNIVYSAMGNININAQNSLRIFARSTTRNPSISQLQDIADFSNSTQIIVGNSSLKPTYTNYVNAYYVNSNIAKGRTFTLSGGLQYTTDYIGDSITTYNASTPPVIPGSDGKTLTSGQRYSKYVNMGDSWQVYGNVSYGFPIRFIASNMTVNIGTILSRTPSIMNGEKYTRNEMYYNGGAQLSSNISENLDFTLSYTGSYNIARSSIAGRTSNDKFINQYASASIKWVFWKGFTFTGNASYNQYKGITTSYNEEYVLCNLYVGKKIFRNQLGEISIGVNDLFNQNKSFRRTVTASTIQNSTSLAIGRYIALQFVYNLRLFGKSASKEASKYDNFDSSSSGSVGIQGSGAGSTGSMPGGRPPHR